MTRPYAEVIGDPIAHSKSPVIHKFWLTKLGLDGDYRATQVADADLAAFIADRRADPDWRGCNVTIPHKIAIMDHVDDPGSVRASIGAMNTVPTRMQPGFSRRLRACHSKESLLRWWGRGVPPMPLCSHYRGVAWDQ